MSASKEELMAAMAAGTLTPEQAVREFEAPAKHISEIDMSQAKAEILPSGLEQLDDVGVLRKGRGRLITIGARPGQGKSALMFQLAMAAAKVGPVLSFSLEMSHEELAERMVSFVLEKPANKLLDGSMDKVHMARGMKELGRYQLYLDDRERINIDTLRSAALNFASARPPVMIVIDYLQLIRSQFGRSREQEVAEITGGLKGLANKLKCPIIVGAQLNRNCETRGRSDGNYIPMLSDLRESGSIEQDSDAVIFLSRQEEYDGTRPGEADVVIAKNRAGPKGRLLMKFSHSLTRFYDRRGYGSGDVI